MTPYRMTYSRTTRHRITSVEEQDKTMDATRIDLGARTL